MKSNILIFIIILFCSVTFAQQNSSLLIKDLIVTKDNLEEQNDSLNINYTIVFKISNVAIAKKAYLNFGAAKDNGDILTIEPIYIQQNSSYLLSYNSNNLPVLNYTSAVKVKILKATDPSLKFLTLYLEDLNGVLTQKLYFQIKP